MIVFCVAAGVLGLVLGYTLNWALRHNPQPDAREVIALIGMVAGGVVIQLVKDDVFDCTSGLAWYLIGVGAGFFFYTLALWKGWERIKTLMEQGKLKGTPFSVFKYW